jgi:signal transduction histidine kinase
MEMIEKDMPENTVILRRIKQMRDSVNLIDEQMSDVLNYIKKPTIDIVESNLSELLEKAIHNVEIPKEITVNIPSKDMKIFCDPVRMVLVFINILTNAIDAMNKQGTITINSNKNGHFLTIDFGNTGPSIPEDIMEKIFEPLFTTKPTGTGLGLATCKKIIQQHNGKISVRNNPTTITIEIPTALL